MKTVDTPEGHIVQVKDVVMSNGATWGMQTVVYERNGTRYLGCKMHNDTYYFGGGGDLKWSSDVHEAWARAYK